MAAFESQRSSLGDVEPHELARRAHSGCANSFEELARRYRPRLLTVLERRLGGSLPDAEDVAQEALARAWQKLELYDDRYQFSTWLYTIAFRLATDHGRKHKRRRNDVSLAANAEPSQTPDFQTAVQVKEEAGNLWSIAHSVLTEPQYTVMWLRYAEDLSVKEVAHATGRTTVSTRVILHRARKLLQRHATEPKNDRPGGLS
ncbi:MAG: RNA polymerase sigma factor [Planctomycetaceae bacterium]